METYARCSRLCTILDVDECENGTHGCAHNCLNNDGSFECRCTGGYALQDDGKSCSGNATYNCNLGFVSLHIGAFCCKLLFFLERTTL